MTRRHWQILLRDCAAFTAYLCIVIACQRVSHATGIGFGSYPDESSHYITGLMVHDYLKSGLSESPVAYARHYYLYMPLLGIGHWPPLFYAVEAVWMLLFGISRGTVLVLVALITAACAYTLYRLANESVGRFGAFLVGLWFLALPAVRWSDDLIMIDVFAAVTIFWATAAFARFLQSGSARDSLIFGLLAGVAFWAKPAALCLAFVPPLAIAASRRYVLLRRPALWLCLPVILLLAGPWYLLTLRLAFYGHNDLGLVQQIVQSVPLFFIQLWSELGVLLVFAFAGLTVWFLKRRKQASAMENCLGVLPLAVLLSVILAKVDLEPRYLIPALAPLLVFAGVAIRGLLQLAPVRGARRWVVPAGLGVCTVAFAATSRLPALISDSKGVEALASQTLTAAGSHGTTILVAAPTAAGEGRMMAELAMQSTRRPFHVIVRGTKLLASMDWNATTYQSCCQTPDQMLDVLDRSGVDLLAIDTTGKPPTAWSHYDLLLTLTTLHTDRFRQLGEFPQQENPTYRLYRVQPARQHEPRPDLMRKKLDEKFSSGLPGAR